MRRTVFLSVLTILAMTGCSAGPAESQTAASADPTKASNQVDNTCNEFSDLTNRVAELVVKVWTDDEVQPADADELENTGALFDTMALHAEGEIGERIAAVAKITLATSPVVMSVSPDEYFAALESVQRACAAEGVEIGIGRWS